MGTKYPVLLVHGTGFRDRKLFGYWGRIPKALEERGVQVLYGNQDSWASIEKNALVLQEVLRHTVEHTGSKKVNIIAHSKGGLEARYLASTLGCGGCIASITTISTPHHGSKTMDAVCRLPKALLRAAGKMVNLWFRLLGDKHPDFYRVCTQFTTTYMEEFNRCNPDVQGILYQSYATVMTHPFSDMLMWFPNWIIGLVEGENDGMVALESAKWADFQGVWRGSTARGISHADAVNMRRRNLTRRQGDEMADIRNCYINIVDRLEDMGL